MEQRKRPFRFRIPWISGPPVARPAAAESLPRRPKNKSKSPAAPDTSASIQHSPFQPPPSLTQTQPPTTSSLSKPTPNDTTPPASSASQQEKEKRVVPEPALTVIPKSQEHTPPGTSSQPHKMSTRHITIGGNSESQSNFHQSQTVERKMMFATSNPSGKGVKVVSSTDPAISNVSSMSPQKPVLPNEQKRIREDVSNFVQKLATGDPMQPMDEKEFGVITLAGDNRGATMHIGSDSAKKEGSIHIHRAYRNNPEESPEVSTDGEESSQEEPNNSMKEDGVGDTYVNSNVQSMNNSLMFHSSINERDPGVQLILPQKPAHDRPCPETRKAEFNVSRFDKLTYQPRIRRRCLRGLFLETSDSDPDNPDKPRRHGCKFSCGRDKEKRCRDSVTNQT